MTDREERQHVIEVLKQMRLDYEDFWEENDTEEIKAFNYAIASIETDLKYDLLYEETSGQTDESTTKNNLGVDWESYKDVDGNSLDDLILEVLQNNFDCGNTYGYKVADEIIGLLPPVTPQEPRKGEWLRMSDLSEQEDDRYKCSRCGNVIHHKDKMNLYTFNSWCGRCGSDNGGFDHLNALDELKEFIDNHKAETEKTYD